MSMKKHRLLVLGTSAVLSAPLPALAQETAPVEVREDSFIEALKAGKVIADYRLRYESVDDNISDDARALTGRIRLGYQTGSWGGFKLLGEFTNTSVWNSNFFGVSQFFPEDAGYATIADPGGTDLNRAVISYEAWDSAWLGLGRQRIILDNARWVGNVDWRQKEQTFDAGSVDFNIGQSWTLSYDYMTRVNGITDADRFSYDASNHIANVAFTGWDWGSFVGYGYFLDNEDSNDKNDTVGLRFNGSVKPNNLAWLYTAEYARQEAKVDSKGRDFDTGYYHLMGGIGFGKMAVKVGYEVLGSDGGGYGLQTPLATKFAFNGWADMFLTTPDDGLIDTYVDFSAKWLGAKWGAIVHDFSADKGSDHYGRELDLVLAKTFAKYYTFGFKYADYRADDFSKDRRKAWFWFDFKY